MLKPVDGSDSRGVEDPRVTEIESLFYITYTAYGREFQGDGEPTHLGGGVLPMVARSGNLITWERMGPSVRGEDNKDHVLFPRRIGGRYAAFHRRRPRCLAGLQRRPGDVAGGGYDPHHLRGDLEGG